MAESANPTQNPAVPPAPVPEAAPAKPAVHRENKWLKQAAELLTSTTLIVLGFILLVVGVFIRTHNPIPHVIQPVFDRFIPRLSYFVAGFGFLCLGQARNMVLAEYIAETKKNRHFTHAWKVPLIIAQVWMLRLIGFYALAVGVYFHPITSEVGSILFLLLFLGYLLWYVIAQFKNHFPSVAGLRISFLAIGLAAACYFSWTLGQMIFVSMVFGFFAVITVIVGALTTSTEKLAQRGNWSKTFCLAGAVAFVFIVCLEALPFDKPHSDLVGLGLAAQDLNGTIGPLAYSPDGEKIAFAQNSKEGYFLQVINRLNESLPIFKIPAGGDSFRPVFISKGQFILADPVVGGQRQLWKVSAATGKVTVLAGSGVGKISEGTPWSEKRGEFLYVSRAGAGYKLNAWSAAKGKSRVIFTSDKEVYSPSWTVGGDEIAYADGIHGTPYLFNVAAGKVSPLMSDEERAENNGVLKGAPVDTVIPAPDDFRYLYVARQPKGKTAIWAVLKDGTKRKMLYESDGTLQDVSWFSDGQRILLTEKRRQYGFAIQSKTVRILDANLDGQIESLILPQITSSSPASSPDGSRVAFVGGQGLWVPSLSQGIWVAILR